MSSPNDPSQLEVPLFTDFTPRSRIQSTAASLLCLSNYRLRTEATSEEPRLRILVGHIAVYDQARDWCRSNLRSADLGLQSDGEEEDQDCDEFAEDDDIYSEKNNMWSGFDSSPYPDPDASEEEQATTNELQDYLHQIPSFQEFQEAIRIQLATVTEVAASINAQSAKEANMYHLESDDDDTDYDSYESSWDGEEDTKSDSGSSATDVDAIESWSICSSPTRSQQQDQLDILFEDKAVPILPPTAAIVPITCAA